MNKTELLKKLKEKTGLGAKEAASALDALLGAITDGLAKGDSVVLTGFGAFKVSARAARTGRNPQTGKTIKIPASKGVKFAPGKFLKDAVK